MYKAITATLLLLSICCTACYAADGGDAAAKPRATGVDIMAMAGGTYLEGELGGFELGAAIKTWNVKNPFGFQAGLEYMHTKYSWDMALVNNSLVLVNAAMATTTRRKRFNYHGALGGSVIMSIDGNVPAFDPNGSESLILSPRLEAGGGPDNVIFRVAGNILSSDSKIPLLFSFGVSVYFGKRQ